MTNEEAIKTLKAIIHIIPNEYYNEETEGALHMAIKALELISEASVEEVIKAMLPHTEIVVEDNPLDEDFVIRVSKREVYEQCY